MEGPSDLPDGRCVEKCYRSLNGIGKSTQRWLPPLWDPPPPPPPPCELPPLLWELPPPEECGAE